jgi:suppressor of fused
MSEIEGEEEQAVGWDAIDAALENIYKGKEPRHYAAVIPWMLGGPDPLNGISVWKRLDPSPHWHYVTYGFSELYEKDSDDKEISGYGFELTFRVACDPDDQEPPAWALNLLQNLGRYVFQSGNVFASGHWMNANGPIALETDTELKSIAIIADPELPRIDSPNGRVDFLQLVGLTLDEEQAAKSWNTTGLLKLLEPHMPLWITDLSRESLAGLPDVRAGLEAGAAEEGSSTGQLFTEVLDWSYTKRLLRSPLLTVQIGAGQVDELISLLQARLLQGKEMDMIGPDRSLFFKVADKNKIVEFTKELDISITPQALSALSSILKPVAGRYQVPDLDMAWLVKPTQIRDQQGNIIRTIG